MPRPRVRELAQRSDAPGLRWLALHLLALGLTTALVVAALGSWWLVPAQALDGLVLAHLFALQHECAHRTAFRTRWLNRWLGTAAGIAVAVAPEHFRHEHNAHHRFTQDPQRDPELLDVPASRRAYLLALTGVPYWLWTVRTYALHAVGRLAPGEAAWLPAAARPRVFREARLLSLLYLAVPLSAWLTGWLVASWLVTCWLVPRLLGEPVMRVVRLAEHAGRPQVAEATVGTRTLLVPAPLRLLAWNMNFHAEHHAEPAVPFHALPALHAEMGASVLAGAGGYVAAHQDIWRQIGVGARALQVSGRSSSA